LDGFSGFVRFCDCEQFVVLFLVEQQIKLLKANHRFTVLTNDLSQLPISFNMHDLTRKLNQLVYFLIFGPNLILIIEVVYVSVQNKCHYSDHGLVHFAKTLHTLLRFFQGRHTPRLPEGCARAAVRVHWAYMLRVTHFYRGRFLHFLTNF
jgi:hypothetical protein